MNPMKKLQQSQDGAALVVALGVISIMIIIGLMVTALSMSSTKTVSHDQRQTIGQNVAEAAVDDAIAVTLANFWSIYPTGVAPVSSGDGVALFETDQLLADSNGTEIGTYQVWTKQDPDRPGNTLITAKGTVGGENPATETVKVSVKYAPQIFDYAMFVGDPANNQSELELERDSDDGGSVTVIGKMHVNGKLKIEAEGAHGGDIILQSRPGYSDTVTYTTEYDENSGISPASNITPTQGPPIDFPTVNYAADLTTSANSGPAVTVTFPSSGTLPGWTRSSSTFRITAQEFYNRYEGRVVKFRSNVNNVKIDIVGSAASPLTITSTIQILPRGSGAGTSPRAIEELNIIGPGITMLPANGIAILSAQGEVEIKNGVNIGAPGNGALIFCTGTVGDSEFEIEGGGTVYGSVVVKGKEGELETGGEDFVAQNTLLAYDGSYISKLPIGWWDQGAVTAYKENYLRD
ncbi:MAG: pilus assembly PilX N-terminal domain-containing protein [Actinobacteria bacterium]|nr:pilus assembly PilX N-terminal domain-containing protein [Actinomycetota bacterium]